MTGYLKRLSLELPRLGLIEGFQFFDGPVPYRVTAAKVRDVWEPPIADVQRLDRRLKNMRRRFNVAADRDEPVKPGTMYTGETADGEIALSLSILADDAIAFQFFATQVTLKNDAADELLRAFEQFSADAPVVGGSSRIAGAGPNAGNLDRQLAGLHAEYDRRSGW